MTYGAPSIRYHATHKFNTAEWAEIVAAKGDFAVVGIAIKKDAPIPNFRELMNWRQLRAAERYPR